MVLVTKELQELQNVTGFVEPKIFSQRELVVLAFVVVCGK